MTGPMSFWWSFRLTGDKDPWALEPCPSLHHTYGFALFQVCRGASEKQMGCGSYMDSESKWEASQCEPWSQALLKLLWKLRTNRRETTPTIKTIPGGFRVTELYRPKINYLWIVSWWATNRNCSSFHSSPWQPFLTSISRISHWMLRKAQFIS